MMFPANFFLPASSSAAGVFVNVAKLSFTSHASDSIDRTVPDSSSASPIATHTTSPTLKILFWSATE